MIQKLGLGGLKTGYFCGRKWKFDLNCNLWYQNSNFRATTSLLFLLLFCWQAESKFESKAIFNISVSKKLKRLDLNYVRIVKRITIWIIMIWRIFVYQTIPVRQQNGKCVNIQTSLIFKMVTSKTYLKDANFRIS